MKFIALLLLVTPLFSSGQKGVVVQIIDNYDLMINERNYFIPDSVFAKLIDHSELLRKPNLHIGTFVHLFEINDSFRNAEFKPECEFFMKKGRNYSTVRAFYGEYKVRMELMSIEDYVNLKPSSSVYSRDPYVGANALLTYVVILERAMNQSCISDDYIRKLGLNKKRKTICLRKK
jgi:hypothetical protein